MRKLLFLVLLTFSLWAVDQRTIKVISLGEVPLAGKGDVELYYLLGSGFYCMTDDDTIKVHLDDTSQSLRRLHFRSLSSITDKYTLQLYENDEKVFVRLVSLTRGFEVEE